MSNEIPTPRTDALVSDRERICFHPDDLPAAQAILEHAQQLERELANIEAALAESGTAVGNEHKPYTAAERIRQITKQRDYYMGACDDAREQVDYLEGRYYQAMRIKKDGKSQ